MIFPVRSATAAANYVGVMSALKGLTNKSIMGKTLARDLI